MSERERERMKSWVKTTFLKTKLMHVAISLYVNSADLINPRDLSHAYLAEVLSLLPPLQQQ